MSKVAHYLQEHLVGEVMTNPDARRYFATDASIFTLPPALVVYPRNENDVRKTARFSWQLAERGRIVPITARGLGTDQSGAALGSGIMMVFPSHMNRIIDFDGKAGEVTVEPGINYGKLQQTLHTHYRFLPPYPASLEYSTIGGAIANNAGGEKSVKYGSTRDFVKRLRVVLANGEVIETRRLNKRELSKKLGLSTMEGEIYRHLDKLIEDNYDLIQKSVLTVSKNSSGYALSSVRGDDGSFDLTPLFVGSQGTLGVVTEATLTTETHNPNTTLIVAFLDDLKLAQEVIWELCNASEKPSALEMVDDNLLKFVEKEHPTLLAGIVQPPYQRITLLIEYDTPNDRIQKKAVKKAVKLLKRNQIVYQVETDADNKERYWKIRNSASAVISQYSGSARPLPVIEDGVVPQDRLQDYLEAIYKMFKAYGFEPAIWGHAGNANLHIQPVMDLSQVGDRQRLFKLLDDYYSLVINLGGSITGQHGDGRLRGPFVEKLFGTEVYKLFEYTKKIFDPFGILNPGVKIGVKLDDVKPLLRSEYSLSHFYDHLPRS
jgi:FAD/FMN-containing dehydrogenase